MLSACKPEAKEATQTYPLKIVSKTGELRGAFTVERAVTRKEQEKGLMYRESMPADHGMIFVYNPPSRTYFWMKNTLIPLDMVFIGPLDQVVHIHKGAKPHDLTAISSVGVVRGALEINAGLVDKLGISKGDKVIFNNYQ